MESGEVEQPEVRGPRTSVVLLATAAVAAIVIGGVLGYRVWRSGDADDDESTAGPPTIPPTSEEPAVPLAARVLTRTTVDGIELRADSMAAAGMDAEQFGMGPNSDDVPPFCRIVDQINAFAISEVAVIQGGGPLTEEAPDELSPMLMFGASGSGVVAVYVQVADDVERVRLTTPDGFDEMAPVDGVAVLAVRSNVAIDGMFPMATVVDDGVAGVGGGGPGDLGDVIVTATAAGGLTTQARGDRLMRGPPAWEDPACFGEQFFEDEVPPETIDPDDPSNPFAVQLPPPGEQPPDPAAAKGAIATALEQLYGAADPAIDPLTLVDDPFAVREMLDDARAKGDETGEEWDEAAVESEEIVFLTPVEAAFEYTLETSQTTHHEQFGRARLVEGTWRIGRSTLCRDLLFYGVNCPP